MTHPPARQHMPTSGHGADTPVTRGQGREPARTPLTQTLAETEAELRMGVTPIEQLMDDRNELIEQVATLRAKYGSQGTYQDLRKIELCRLQGLVRAEAVRDKVKRTETEIDQMAHQRPEYMEFVTMATTERAQWVRLESKIEAIDFVINRGQSVARFVANETAMQR